MMVRKALWDRCTAAAFLHPSYDALRSLFARAKPAPGDKAGLPILSEVSRLHGSVNRATYHIEEVVGSVDSR